MSGFTQQRVTDLVARVRAHTREQLIDLTRQHTLANEAAIQRVFGHEAPYDQWIDGSPNKALEQAQEFTLTRFHLHTNIVDAAIRMLIARSPYGPGKDGHYRDDHWLFVNEVRRDATAEGSAVEILPGDRVVIVNMRPYARKIEGGPRNRFRNRLTDRRPGLSTQAPNGVYEITARDLQRMFGTIANIRFAYRGTIGGTLAPFADSPRPVVRSSRGRFVSTGGPMPGNRGSDRFPALEIEAKAA